MNRTVEQLKKDFPEVWKQFEKARTNNLVFDNGHNFHTTNHALKRWKEGYIPEDGGKVVSKSYALKKLRKLRSEYQDWVKEVDRKIKTIEQLGG